MWREKGKTCRPAWRVWEWGFVGAAVAVGGLRKEKSWKKSGWSKWCVEVSLQVTFALTGRNAASAVILQRAHPCVPARLLPGSHTRRPIRPSTLTATRECTHTPVKTSLEQR